MATTTTTTHVPPEISYLKQYKVVVCLVCQTGVRPGKGCETHWRNQHQMHGQSLQAILDYISTVSCCDPHRVELPSHRSRAIPELGTPLDGFSCSDCTFLTLNKKRWQSHISLTGHDRSGGAAQHAVQLQTFSRGRHARYWVVKDERDQDRSGESELIVGDVRTQVTTRSTSCDQTKKAALANQPGSGVT